jgi:hypothetical protein
MKINMDQIDYCRNLAHSITPGTPNHWPYSYVEADSRRDQVDVNQLLDYCRNQRLTHSDIHNRETYYIGGYETNITQSQTSHTKVIQDSSVFSNVLGYISSK